MNHSQNGVEIQFYVLMMVAILTLKLKKVCGDLEKEGVAAEKAKEIGKIRQNG